jgi:hypothetical protein
MRSRGGPGGMDVLQRGGVQEEVARGAGAGRWRGGGGIRCWSHEPKPEASPSCLVFRLKGQRPIIVLVREDLVATAAGMCGRGVRGPTL